MLGSVSASGVKHTRMRTAAAAIACMLASAPAVEAACTAGTPGECTKDGCCTEPQPHSNTTWDLKDLAGDRKLTAPADRPGKEYVFNLFDNVAKVPLICEREDDFTSNAFEYDQNTRERSISLLF